MVEQLGGRGVLYTGGLFGRPSDNWLPWSARPMLVTNGLTGQEARETIDVMKQYEFTVVIERDEDGRYLAICPALQGCYTEGETPQQARELIEDAIRLHIEDRLAAGEPINQEVGADKVRVAV